MRKVSPSLIILLLTLPFILLVATGTIRIPGSTFILNSYAFDGTTRLTSTGGTSCTVGNTVPSPSGYTYPPNPSWCRWGQNIVSTSPSTANIIGGSQSFTYQTGQLDSASIAGPYGYGCYYFLTCNAYGFASAKSNEQLAGSMSASNWQLLGSTANSGFQSQFNEPSPGGQVGPCPYTAISNGCNPYTLNFTSQNGWIGYNIYRFTMVATLQIQNDALVAQTWCAPDSDGNGQACFNVETNALSNALNFINTKNAIAGTLDIDLSVPDPFYITGSGKNVQPSSTDSYGIIGTWIAGSGCIVTPGNVGTATPLKFGGVAQVTPCNGHIVVTNRNLAFTPASNEPSLTGYTNPFTSNLNPNAVLSLTINDILTHYMAVTCQSVSGSNCPQSTNMDGLSAGGIIIQYDASIAIQIPLIIDVIGTGPNLQGQAKAVSGTSGTGTANYTAIAGNIQVKVVDSLTGLPIAGIPVNYGNGGTCSTSNFYGTTNQQGTVTIQGLNAGLYTVCSTGQSGYVTFIFFTVGFQYSLGSAAVSVTSGQTAQTTLSLQPSLYSALTTLSIILVVVGIIVLLVVIIAAPRSLVTLGLGGVRGVRELRGRKH